MEYRQDLIHLLDRLIGMRTVVQIQRVFSYVVFHSIRAELKLGGKDQM